MFGYYYGFDLTYIVLVLPCVILAMIASANVNSTFKRYSQIHSFRRITGAQAAERVLRANGVTGVRIERVRGNLRSTLPVLPSPRKYPTPSPHPFRSSVSEQDVRKSFPHGLMTEGILQ